MPSLYETKSCYAKPNAQANLDGRTHYAEEDTLRFHKSRILGSVAVDSGLLFAMVESVALDWDNTRRGFRYVVFDVFGHVISRVDLEHCWHTKAQATEAMWEFLNTCDAPALTLEGIEREDRRHAMEMDHLRSKLAELQQKAA